jgi:hypothetical protein
MRRREQGRQRVRRRATPTPPRVSWRGREVAAHRRTEGAARRRREGGGGVPTMGMKVAPCSSAPPALLLHLAPVLHLLRLTQGGRSACCVPPTLNPYALGDPPPLVSIGPLL